MIQFTINSKPVTAKKGETILNVARREGIYIPTMCYLEKTTPCASCRLCSVEAEGVDGFILSCNTPPTEGLAVVTDSEKLHQERTNIMKLYDVNHPLECGVCDKSGECDLQNMTLAFQVDEQNFTARDQHRKIEHWNFINYDPSLCILCEKCVHVCNEIIGDDAIDLQFGGYSSKVIPKNSETLDCTFCGECIAVCPVGALVSSDFQYSANAWELSRIPSTCAHCSAGCALEYEIKHASIESQGKERIYRVKNDFEHTTLCGAGRFAYDFDCDASRDEKAFNRAVEALSKADSIAFSSMISNEEALLLQRVKARKGIKLINEEARHFKAFLEAFAQASGTTLYNASLDDVAQSDHIIVLGSRISSDNPQVRYHMTMASKRNRARISYMHPIEDALLQNIVTQFIKYEVGTEEGVVALLLQTLLSGLELDEHTKHFISELDEGYLSAESNIGEEELELMAKQGLRSKKRTLVVGSDLFEHPRALNIAKMLGLIQKYSDFKVLLVPQSVNTLGVALICDLDAPQGLADVAYNAEGAFVLAATPDADLPMPALNQQEGTVCSINKHVLPMNVATAFEGYTLLDLLKVVNEESKAYTIEYTKELPEDKGFKPYDFDALENRVDALSGEDIRGYFLDAKGVDSSGLALEAVDELPEFNGTIVYNSNPVLQFNAFTAKAHQLKDELRLKGSKQFALAAKISDGDVVVLDFGSQKLERIFELDETLKGTVALNPDFDLGLKQTFGYRFNKVNIIKGKGNE